MGVDGTHRNDVITGSEIERVPPLNPRVDRRHATDLGPLPRVLVDLHLDGTDADARRPRHTGHGHRPSRDGGARAGHVDARLELDGAVPGPAPLDPEAVGVLEA